MTTPKCIHCNDTGRLIGSDYFDCVHCGTAFARIALRDAINQFAETDAGAFGNENLVWFIHQRATSMARASALAELHPNWLAEKERADRAEAELAALRAAPLPADTDKLREALKMAMIQNSCDMLMTSEEMRQCEAALASTAGQAPVREVPGWISVDEQFPELTIRDENKVVIEGRSIPPMTSSEKVIVCLDDGNRRIDRAVRLDGSDHTFFQSYGARVMYWQSLPAAPVQTEGE